MMPSTSNNRKRNADEGFQNDSDGTEPAKKKRRLSGTQNNEDLTPVPEPTEMTPTECHGTKRKADEAFREDEGTEPAPKRMGGLTDSEPAPFTGPQTLNIDDPTPVPEPVEMTSEDCHGTQIKADEVFPEDEGMEPAPKRSLADSEPAPFPGPQTQNNADSTPAPQTCATEITHDDDVIPGPSGINADPRSVDPIPRFFQEYHGTKRKADEVSAEDEGTEPAPKRRLADSEPAPFPGLQTQNNADSTSEISEDDTVPASSGINAEPSPVGLIPGFVQVISEDEEDEAVPEQLPEQDIHRAPNAADFLLEVPFNIRVLDRVTFQYEVLEEVVHGGDSMVLAAIRRVDGQQVVLKCVHIAADDPQDVPWIKSYRHDVPGFDAGVFREIGMMLEMQLAPVPCTEVVHMLDWFEFPDGYVVVLERLSEPWVRLDTFIEENHGTLSERVGRNIVRQLLRTFTFFSHYRVRHTGMTPEHIIINRETLKLKLIGFGRSRRVFLYNLDGCHTTVPFFEDPQYLSHIYGVHLLQLPTLFFRMFRFRLSRGCRRFREMCFRPFQRRIENFLNHRWITDDY